jgi:dTDP-L-rhamnose 4-epimerase
LILRTAIAIFCTRLLNNLSPVLYEDGEQTRDFSFVEDIARANLLAAETDELDGLAVNIGSGKGTPIREIAQTLSNLLKINIAPQINGEFRPGEMRHLTSDITLARSAGYKPTVDLKQGIARYIDFFNTGRPHSSLDKRTPEEFYFARCRRSNRQHER